MDISILGCLHASYTRILAAHYPSGDSELWLNRNEHAVLGAPTAMFGLPVHTSIAIPAGEVAVFDRKQMTYLRDPSGA